MLLSTESLVNWQGQDRPAISIDLEQSLLAGEFVIIIGVSGVKLLVLSLGSQGGLIKEEKSDYLSHLFSDTTAIEQCLTVMKG